MDWLNVLLTSVSMSIDACAVNATNGVSSKKRSTVLLAAGLFGIFQFLMPTIGYFLGFGFKDVLQPYIPYIGFGLLMLLAVKSLIDWVKEFKSDEPNKGKKDIGFLSLLVQAIATSIDALCIGFVFLSYSIPDALLSFAIIGVVAFALSLVAGLLGNLLSKILERWAGLISCLVFIGVAIKILLS